MGRRQSNRFVSAAIPAAAGGNGGPPSRFRAIPRSMTRSKRAVPLVYLFDEMLVMNCAFGRLLDSEGVTAFSIVADDRAQEIGIRVFRNGEEQQLPDSVHAEEGIFALRPNGPTRNAGRRLNIAYVQKDRGWLQKDMTGQKESERHRMPVFDARDGVFVLKAAD